MKFLFSGDDVDQKSNGCFIVNCSNNNSSCDDFTRFEINNFKIRENVRKNKKGSKNTCKILSFCDTARAGVSEI
ncbi:MAG: hypothetical protein Q4B52_08100 [Tissierellia bacterium]|nr:hypothetical protein [Tissierellia bacterium]